MSFIKITHCKLSTKRLLEFFVLEVTVRLDESYFSGIHKGKRGRGVSGKMAVFGLLKLKRNGRVYTVVVKDTR